MESRTGVGESSEAKIRGGRTLFVSKGGHILHDRNRLIVLRGSRRRIVGLTRKEGDQTSPQAISEHNGKRSPFSSLRGGGGGRFVKRRSLLARYLFGLEKKE